MASRVIALFRLKNRPADWSPEEIAELYRIEHMLRQARFSLETDRGVSDEGDPWFVFCRADGEVLVHIVRTDDEYFLYGAGLAQPLRGRFIGELSTSFVGQLSHSLPVRRPDDTRLFVHPAAALAVLIGTILVALDDLHFNVEHLADANEGIDRFGQAVGRPVLPIALSKHADTLLGEIRIEPLGREAAYFNVVCAVAAAIGTAALSMEQVWEVLPGVGAEEAANISPVPATKAYGDVAPGGGDSSLKIANFIHILEGPVLSGVDDQTSERLGSSFSSVDQIVLKQEITAAHEIDLGIASVASNFQIETDLSESVQHLWRLPMKVETANQEWAGGFGQGAFPTIATNVNREAAAGSVQESPIGTNQHITITAASPHDNSMISIEQFLQSAIKLALLPTATLKEVVSAVQSGADLNAPLPSASDNAGPFGKVESSTNLTLYPLFDAGAHDILTNFLKQNAAAQVIFDHGNVIVYDGLKDFESSRVTVHVWEFDTGATIAIVGHVDHPATAHL